MIRKLKTALLGIIATLSLACNPNDAEFALSVGKQPDVMSGSEASESGDAPADKLDIDG